MGFTLGVENAPVPATQWGCYCNCDTILLPNSVREQPTKPYGALPLSERWVCVDPAPSENPIDVMCLDADLNTVQESFVTVTILDGRDYTFDFATETLVDVTALPDWTAIIGPLLVLGFMAGMVSMMAPALKEGFS